MAFYVIILVRLLLSILANLVMNFEQVLYYKAFDLVAKTYIYYSLNLNNHASRILFGIYMYFYINVFIYNY